MNPGTPQVAGSSSRCFGVLTGLSFASSDAIST
jgi:hypothetical protein